jgi:hypothetical protein
VPNLLLMCYTWSAADSNVAAHQLQTQHVALLVQPASTPPSDPDPAVLVHPCRSLLLVHLVTFVLCLCWQFYDQRHGMHRCALRKTTLGCVMDGALCCRTCKLQQARYQANARVRFCMTPGSVLSNPHPSNSGAQACRQHLSRCVHLRCACTRAQSSKSILGCAFCAYCR